MARAHRGVDQPNLADTFVKIEGTTRWVRRARALQASGPEGVIAETSPAVESFGAPPQKTDREYDFTTLFDIDDSENFQALLGVLYTQVDDRYRILSKLGVAMIAPLPSSDQSEDDEALPAGYTYLGQFIAHDISFAAEQNPGLDELFVETSERRNIRDRPLLLGGIYGDGPIAFPLGYACPEFKSESGKLRRMRTHLRLGPIPKGDASLDVHRPDGDLPRVTCPHLDDTYDPLPSNHADFRPMARLLSLVDDVIERARELSPGDAAEAVWNEY